MIFNCNLCGKEFIDIKHKNRKYCSYKCHKKSIKHSNLFCSYCNNEFKYRKNGKFCSRKCMGLSFVGHEQKQEWIEKQRIKISGDKCWLWKGGISKEPYGLEFNNSLKTKIRQRDNFQCQECRFNQEQLGYKLPIHHIDFNKQNNNFNNLICLCRSCHGKTYYNRENWVVYFQNKLNEVKNG